jgi:hypothetical protein
MLHIFLCYYRFDVNIWEWDPKISTFSNKYLGKLIHLVKDLWHSLRVANGRQVGDNLDFSPDRLVQ